MDRVAELIRIHRKKFNYKWLFTMGHMFLHMLGLRLCGEILLLYRYVVSLREVNMSVARQLLGDGPEGQLTVIRTLRLQLDPASR